jgi:hypothetical protein
MIRCSGHKMWGAAMVWRQGQSYSEDLRARVLVAVDGAVGGQAFPGQRVVHLQGADPAGPHRGGQRQRAARPPAAQTDPGATSRPSGAHRGQPGPHPGRAAGVAVGRARGSAVQRGDVVGGRPAVRGAGIGRLSLPPELPFRFRSGGSQSGREPTFRICWNSMPIAPKRSLTA